MISLILLSIAAGNANAISNDCAKILKKTNETFITTDITIRKDSIVCIAGSTVYFLAETKLQSVGKNCEGLRYKVTINKFNDINVEKIGLVYLSATCVSDGNTDGATELYGIDASEAMDILHKVINIQSGKNKAYKYTSAKLTPKLAVNSMQIESISKTSDDLYIVHIIDKGVRYLFTVDEQSKSLQVGRES